MLTRLAKVLRLASDRLNHGTKNRNRKNGEHRLSIETLEPRMLLAATVLSQAIASQAVVSQEYAPAAVVAAPADFDNDGDVDGNDLAQWEDNFGADANADADSDGDSDGADFLAWQRQFTGDLSPDFSDDFSTDTTGNYTVVDTRGTIGTFSYAAGQRAQVTTGDNVGLQFSQAVLQTDSNIFQLEFNPTQKFPAGGELWIRLRQDANNYYEIYNTDGYNQGAVSKFVDGVEVQSVDFVGDYSQNNHYTITVDFSPTETTVNAFDEQLTLAADSTSIVVGSFEVDSHQQTAYFDNIWLGNVLPTTTGTTYYVDTNAPNASNSNSGTSESSPFKTLDFGIEQLNAGDTLLIKAGTYGPVNVNGLNGTAANPITIKNFQNDVVTVDAFKNGAVARHAMNFDNSSYVIIDGLKLTDSDPQVSELVGKDPIADFSRLTEIKDVTGNGMKFHESDHMTIQNSEIFHTGSHGVLTTGKVTSNNPNPTHSNSVLNNIIHTGIKSLSSYGVYLKGPDNTIKGNTIYNNTGHGLHLHSTTTPLVDSIIENNVIYDNGGEAWLFVSSGVPNKKVGGSNAILWNGTGNTFQNNIFYYTEDYKNDPLSDGDGFSDNLIIAADTNTIVNNTIYNAVDKGVRFHATRSFDNVLFNNVIWSNDGGEIGYTSSATAGAQAALTNNLTADPLFVDAANADFHLTSTTSVTSPAIDAGIATNAPSVDFDGIARPQGAGYDIGAFEAIGTTYFVGPVSGPGIDFTTIQAAANIVQPGDTVIIKDGIYTDVDQDPEDAVVSLTRSGTAGAWITFKSENQWGAKLDGENATKFGIRIFNSASYIRIEGLEIKDMALNGVSGKVSNPGGAQNNSSHVYFYGLYIHDIARTPCTLSGSGCGDRSAMNLSTLGSNYTVDSSFLDTFGRTDSGPAFKNSDHNHDHGIGKIPLDSLIINNVVVNAASGWAIGTAPADFNGKISGSPGTRIINNTVVSTNPTHDGGILIRANNVTVANNIIISTELNTHAIEVFPSESNGIQGLGLHNNLTNVPNLWGFNNPNDTRPVEITGTATNILDADPGVAGATLATLLNGNPVPSVVSTYELLSSSLAVGAGIPNVAGLDSNGAPITVFAPSVDYNGVARPQGAQHDIGAFEFVPPAALLAPGGEETGEVSPATQGELFDVALGELIGASRDELSTQLQLSAPRPLRSFDLEPSAELAERFAINHRTGPAAPALRLSGESSRGLEPTAQDREEILDSLFTEFDEALIR